MLFFIVSLSFLILGILIGGALTLTLIDGENKFIQKQKSNFNARYDSYTLERNAAAIIMARLQIGIKTGSHINKRFYEALYRELSTCGSLSNFSITRVEEVLRLERKANLKSVLRTYELAAAKKDKT